MRYYIFNLIFTSTLAHSLWAINYDFSHVGFVSLDAIGKPIGKINLVDDHFELSIE
jgi:predicted permease